METTRKAIIITGPNEFSNIERATEITKSFHKVNTLCFKSKSGYVKNIHEKWSENTHLIVIYGVRKSANVDIFFHLIGRLVIENEPKFIIPQVLIIYKSQVDYFSSTEPSFKRRFNVISLTK